MDENEIIGYVVNDNRDNITGLLTIDKAVALAARWTNEYPSDNPHTICPVGKAITPPTVYRYAVLNPDGRLEQAFPSLDELRAHYGDRLLRSPACKIVQLTEVEEN